MNYVNIGNEQWLLDGNCSKCRRREYCSKPCKKYNTRRTNMMRGFIVNKIIEKMTKGEK